MSRHSPTVFSAEEPEINRKTPDWEQEIRFAIVLYGGVSLAIYMNGVVQELYRMVRATADLPDGQEISGTEEVYRDLGRLLHPGYEPDKYENCGKIPLFDTSNSIRTRFVVDILSGSSAGGINGVYLAKALALRLKNLDLLTKTWLQQADLDVLLNDEKSDFGRYPSGDEKASLLNSERMYGMLLEKLREMNDQKRREMEEQQASANDGRPFADNIDLFVTATDLNGVNTPIQLTDKSINERVHKTVFHFEYDGDEDREEANDLTAEFDPMLAFAARCTSSFPVAFQPMTFKDTGRQLKRQYPAGTMSSEKATQSFAKFFSRYNAEETDFIGRAFADGGYLDNRPYWVSTTIRFAGISLRSVCQADKNIN